MGKTWIFVALAIITGSFATFSLILGPLFLFGIMQKADGTSGTDGGIALSAMSIPLLLGFFLAVYNVRARRIPLLRVCREGIEIVQVGSSSLDKIPQIPALIRIGWLILSTQGFGQKVIRVPWERFQGAWVSGPPTARRLSITTSPAPGDEEGLPVGIVSVEKVVLAEHSFKTPIDQIVEAINSRANSSIALCQLPSWHQTESSAA